MPGIVISKPGITLSEADARYYQQSQFIDSTAGVADAGKPIKTDATGEIDMSFISSTVVLESELIDATTGVTDAGKPVKTDSTGILDMSFISPTVVLESELINATTGVADADKPIKTDAGGLLDDSFIDSTTVAATDKFVKTLSSTGILDPTLTSQDQTKEPTGFVNRTDSTLSFVDGTRTFTITGTNFIVYSCGVKITKNTESIVIPNTTGLYWIYYAPITYVLTANVTPPGFDSGAILIANIYWNATKGEAIPPGDERHMIAMDWNTHEMMHKTIRTRYEKGLTGTFTDTTMEVTSGTVWDEDIELSIPLTTQCPVLYRDGTEWEWTTPNNTVHYSTGGNIQYDNAGVLTPAGANDYVAYFVFATNSITYPIVSIMGQRTDGTLANARANNTYESLSFGDLPFAEYKVLYRVIVRNDATPYEETQDLRSIQGLPGTNYVATSHGALTGLLNDDHTQYQLRSEFIDTTAGAADAAKPVETNASGLVDDTFIANAVLKSETIASTAGAGDAGKVPKTDAAGKLDVSFLPPPVGAVNDFSAGRLCLATGAPDTINQTGSATLYWTPYKGNTISLIISGVITEKTFTEQSIDFSAKTAAKPYDIFAYWDSGAGEVKIEELVWTDDTTRATNLTLSNGVYYKSGDTTRKYLGTVYAYDDSGTTKIRDEENYRYVDNFFNKIEKGLKATNTTSTWTYATATWREWNGGTGAVRGNFICGLPTSLTITGYVSVVGVADSIATVWLDGGTSGIRGSYSSNYTTEKKTISFSSVSALAVGLHYISGGEYAYSGTVTGTSSAQVVTKIPC